MALRKGQRRVKQSSTRMTHPDDQSPFNALPPIVVALALLIIAVELAFQAGASGFVGGAEAVGWRLEAKKEFSFFGTAFDWMLQNGRFPLEYMKRFVTYPFVHQGFTHALMVVVFLLAMGKLVGEVFGTFAVLLVFFASAFIGAVVYGLVFDNAAPLVGGYPAVYGLIGCYTFMLWLSYGQAGQSRLSAFQLIGFLIGLQLFFGLVMGGNKDWLADLSGFATGFGLSFALVPGALQRLRDKLRQR